MKHTNNNNHYLVMFVIMFLSGLLSTMNIWVDKIHDIRFSLNDLYMIMLMTGWMFFFMGLFYRELNIILIGVLFITLNIWFIRNQFLITENQYKLSMIPHHSMAIYMSKKLLEKENNLEEVLKNIIHTQEKEIMIFKN